MKSTRLSLIAAGFAVLLGGCKDAQQLHQPGPVIALYQKDGGPPYQTSSPGTYNKPVVDKFFQSRPEILDSFVNHGVCSQVTDPASDEVAQNSLICQSATAASMTQSLKKYQEDNK